MNTILYQDFMLLAKRLLTHEDKKQINTPSVMVRKPTPDPTAMLLNVEL